MEKESQSKRRTYFWKGFCYKCFRSIEFPLLGDFAYGEDIFQTIDGQNFYIAVLSENEVVDEIRNILKEEKYDVREILIQLADKPHNSSFTKENICPKCRRKLWITPTDNKKASERDLPFVTWNSFMANDVKEKERLILKAYKSTQTKTS